MSDLIPKAPTTSDVSSVEPKYTFTDTRSGYVMVKELRKPKKKTDYLSTSKDLVPMQVLLDARMEAGQYYLEAGDIVLVQVETFINAQKNPYDVIEAGKPAVAMLIRQDQVIVRGERIVTVENPRPDRFSEGNVIRTSEPISA